METKTLQRTKLSGEKLAIIVTLNQTIDENHIYRYYVMVKETRNSFNRDNKKYIFNYYEYGPALDMYISQVEQSAHHIAIMSL